MTKTVYPIPGVSIPNVPAEKQAVDDEYAEELVSTGAFSYDNVGPEAAKAQKAMEEQQAEEALQSDVDASNAKMEEHLAENPPEEAEAPQEEAEEPAPEEEPAEPTPQEEPEAEADAKAKAKK